MKNSVLVCFFNTSLFRQDFSHREFDIFYKQAYLQNGEMRRKARTVPVLPRSPSESSYYATLLSLPHDTNPARVSSCSRACCPLNSISYCRYKRGDLVKDLCIFNQEIFDACAKFSHLLMYCKCASCMCKIFIVLVLQWDSSSSNNFSRLKC